MTGSRTTALDRERARRPGAARIAADHNHGFCPLRVSCREQYAHRRALGDAEHRLGRELPTLLIPISVCELCTGRRFARCGRPSPCTPGRTARTIRSICAGLTAWPGSVAAIIRWILTAFIDRPPCR